MRASTPPRADARALAVPHAEDAVVFALPAHLCLLGAPDRRRRQLFVETRLEHDVRAIEPLLGAQEILVETADGRAAIAGDESRRAQALETVALALHQQQAHDGLRPGDEDTILAQIVFVVERYVPESSVTLGSDLTLGHRPYPPVRPLPSSVRPIFWDSNLVRNADITSFCRQFAALRSGRRWAAERRMRDAATRCFHLASGQRRCKTNA
jgi:hypothetical protein